MNTLNTHTAKKKYKIIDHQILQTTTGSLLTITAEFEGQAVTLSFPDIQSIELNNMSSELHDKYYLAILNRFVERDLIDLSKREQIEPLSDENRAKKSKLLGKRTETLRLVTYTVG